MSMTEQFTRGLCGIYSIEFEDKVYVGASKAIQSRWSYHLLRMKNGTHDTPELIEAWKKHGGEGFTFKILELVGSEIKLPEKEYKWMRKLKANLLNRRNNFPNPREHIIVSRETKSRLQSMGMKSMEAAVKQLLDNS